MTSVYDIAIVGAGPAGAVFARELARLCPDKKAVIIDGQTEDRKKPCGGLLAPDAQKVLAEFDLTLPNSILADPQIFTVETIDIASGMTRYYQRHYLNMDRYRFDRWLVSLIPDSVHKLQDRVKHIDRKDGVFALTLSDGTVLAKEIVGADGSNSAVRRYIGQKMPKQYVSIQEWYKNDGQKVPYYSCIFDKAVGDSCSWTIHKNGYILLGGAYDRREGPKAFEKQKARLEEFKHSSIGEAVFREACLVSSPRRFRDLFCGVKGAYLVGEAAGFISASSFEGISSAFVSGRELALAFAQAKAPDKVLGKYRKNTRRLRLKLWTKMFKRAVLCSPILRNVIMKSGVQSIRVTKREH